MQKVPNLQITLSLPQIPLEVVALGVTPDAPESGAFEALVCAFEDTTEEAEEDTTWVFLVPESGVLRCVPMADPPRLPPAVEMSFAKAQVPKAPEEVQSTEGPQGVTNAELLETAEGPTNFFSMEEALSQPPSEEIEPRGEPSSDVSFAPPESSGGFEGAPDQKKERRLPELVTSRPPSEPPEEIFAPLVQTTEAMRGEPYSPMVRYVHPNAPIPSPAVQIALAMTASGEATTEIVLSPEELGTVKIKLEQSAETMIVHVATERAETSDLIRRNLSELSRELTNIGFENVDFSFEEQAKRDQPKGQAQNLGALNFVEPVAEAVWVTVESEGLDLRL